MADSRILAEIPSFITSDGSLDLPSVTAAVHRLINEGYDALIVGGTAGEYENLTLDEQRKLIAAALEAADGKAVIIAGVFELGTAKAAEKIREHAAWGCHHHLCIPAHYFGFSDPGELQLHFRTLAETDGGVIILDSDEHVGYLMPQEVRAMLLSIPGVLAVASHSTDTAHISGAAILREELRLAGVTGSAFISRLAVLFPRLCRQGTEKAPVRQAVLNMLSLGRHPAAAIKHAACYLGLCGSGEVWPPYMPLSSRDKQSVEAICALLAQEERLLHE